MSNERQPLLTEEQIQELGEITPYFLRSHFEDKYPKLYWKCVEGRVHVDFMNKVFLAFLRGKTKRVLNLDRLRADVKAWVDDPDRKWPKWIVTLIDFDNRQELASDSSDLMDDQIQLCMFAATIGINPDDYFEEVEVTE